MAERRRGKSSSFEIVTIGFETEIGYAVGRQFRKQRLASRAVRLVTEFASRRLHLPELVLRIGSGNQASEAVARAAGFCLADDEPIVAESKGRSISLLTWRRVREDA